MQMKGKTAATDMDGNTERDGQVYVALGRTLGMPPSSSEARGSASFLASKGLEKLQSTCSASQLERESLCWEVMVRQEVALPPPPLTDNIQHWVQHSRQNFCRILHSNRSRRGEEEQKPHEGCFAAASSHILSRRFD